jgi:hypothetical protein
MKDLTVDEKKLLIEGLKRLMIHYQRIDRNDIAGTGYYAGKGAEVKKLFEKLQGGGT